MDSGGSTSGNSRLIHWFPSSEKVCSLLECMLDSAGSRTRCGGELDFTRALLKVD